MTASHDLSGIRHNRLKQALVSEETALGTWIHFVRNPSVIRMIAGAGFDFVFLDMEHSSLSIESVGDMCEIARATGITPVIRPASHDAPYVGRLLDIGAMGLMFHDVRTARQAIDLRRAMLYPPKGTRGSTQMHAAQDYASVPAAEMKRFVNDNVVFVAQIESRRGIDNIDAILESGAVDIVEIGRSDLSTDLGVPHETRHPRVLAAVDEIVSACHRHEVVAGVNCSSIEDASDMMRRGVRCISYSSERAILLNAYRDANRQLREVMSREMPKA